jgi:hypothetical protein
MNGKRDELMSVDIVEGWIWSLHDGFPPEEPSPAPDCVSLLRGRELALDPERATVAERAHVGRCRRCSALVARAAELMPHPGTSLLVARLLGVAPVGFAAVYRRHVEEGGCRVCRARERAITACCALRPERRIVLTAAGASAGAPLMELESRAQAGGLEFSILMEEDAMLLEVRTRDPRLSRCLVNYALYGEEPLKAREGYAPLKPDVQGWSVAEIPLSYDRLHEEMQGQIREVVVSAVDGRVLSRAEREEIMELARASGTADPAWGAWLAQEDEQRLDVRDDPRELLRRLLEGEPEQ